MGDRYNISKDEENDRLYRERTPRWRSAVDAVMPWLMFAAMVAFGVFLARR